MTTHRASTLAVWMALAGAMAIVAVGGCRSSNASVTRAPALPAENFTEAPQKPHDPAALYFDFDQLEYYYRVPGEFTYRLTGDQYGFDTMSFIITETHPGRSTRAAG